MLKQVVLTQFQPLVPRFRPWKILKCLEFFKNYNMGRFETKNGSKMRFSKSDPGPFGLLKQVFLAHFEPIEMGFAPWKIPKSVEKGPVWDQTRSKMGQKWVKSAFFHK